MHIIHTCIGQPSGINCVLALIACLKSADICMIAQTDSLCTVLIISDNKHNVKFIMSADSNLSTLWLLCYRDNWVVHYEVRFSLAFEQLKISLALAYCSGQTNVM